MNQIIRISRGISAFDSILDTVYGACTKHMTAGVATVNLFYATYFAVWRGASSAWEYIRPVTKCTIAYRE